MCAAGQSQILRSNAGSRRARSHSPLPRLHRTESASEVELGEEDTPEGSSGSEEGDSSSGDDLLLEVPLRRSASIPQGTMRVILSRAMLQHARLADDYLARYRREKRWYYRLQRELNQEYEEEGGSPQNEGNDRRQQE